jgi:hypothetical protein
VWYNFDQKNEALKNMLLLAIELGSGCPSDAGAITKALGNNMHKFSADLGYLGGEVNM